MSIYYDVVVFSTTDFEKKKLKGISDNSHNGYIFTLDISYNILS